MVFFLKKVKKSIAEKELQLREWKRALVVTRKMKTMLTLGKNKDCRKVMLKREDNSKNIEKTILNINI